MADNIRDAYLRVRGGAISAAGALGLGGIAETAAGAGDIFYTLALLLRDGRLSRRSKLRLGIAAAYMALPLDIAPFGVLDDVYVGLVALAGVLDELGEESLAEYWPGDTAQLRAFLAKLRSHDARFGSGALRRLMSRLGVSVEVEIA